jgi:hypothetical protein
MAAKSMVGIGPAADDRGVESWKPMIALPRQQGHVLQWVSMEIHCVARQQCMSVSCNEEVGIVLVRQQSNALHCNGVADRVGPMRRKQRQPVLGSERDGEPAWARPRQQCEAVFSCGRSLRVELALAASPWRSARQHWWAVEVLVVRRCAKDGLSEAAGHRRGTASLGLAAVRCYGASRPSRPRTGR